MAWLEGIFGSVRCANCGTAYERNGVDVVGNRNEYWFLRCVCHVCGTQGVGVVIVKEVGSSPGSSASATPPKDDAIDTGAVLDAHEQLRDFRGDLSLLFEPKKNS